MKKKTVILLLILVLLLGLGLRLWAYTLNPDNITPSYDDETWSRIQISYDILRHGEYSHLTFAPLYAYLTRYFLIFDERGTVFLLRAVSLIFGMLTILLYFFLMKRLFNEWVGIISAFLLAIYPLHIQLSVITLPETMGYFLMLTSLLFLVKYIDTKNLWLIVISAVLLSMASMLRFECFLLMALFSMYLFYKDKFSVAVFLFLAICSLFPIYWMYKCYINIGHPLEFIIKAESIPREYMQNYSFVQRALGFINVLIHTTGIPISLLAFAGIIECLATKGKRTFLLGIFLFIITIFTLRSIGTVYDSDIFRYTILPGFFFIYFASFFIEFLIIRAKNSKLVLLSLILLLLHLFNYTATALAHSDYPIQDLKDVVQWLQDNRDKQEYTYVDFRYCLPYILYHANDNKMDTTMWWSDLHMKQNEIKKKLKDTELYVIHRDNRAFKETLLNDNKHQHFQTIYTNDQWEIRRSHFAKDKDIL